MKLYENDRIGNSYGNAKLSAYEVIYHMISNTAYTNSTIGTD